MPKLQVLNGKRQGEVFELQPGAEMVIGHRNSAPISIDDPWVSWDHARVLLQPDGTCWIEDLGSTNGTYVNCVRVKRQQLRHEDIIFLGKTHVIYLAPVTADLFGPAPDSVATTPSSLPTARRPFASSSSSGPSFASSAGGLPPLRGMEDPFASRSSQATPAPLWDPKGKTRDPFADSSVDPFSSGPDYSAGSHSGQPLVPPVNNSPFAETRGDDLMGVERRGTSSRRALSLSGLGEDEELSVPGPSSQEISRLIDGRAGNDLLGDLADLSPLPAPAAPSRTGTTFPVGTPGLGLEGKTPSEMRTQPLSTDMVNQLLEEHRRMQELASAPPPPAPLAPLPAAERPPTRFDGEPHAAPPPPPPPPPASAAPPASAGAAALGAVPPAVPFAREEGQQAYDRARLEDEVRRLRMALQAAQRQNPQAVMAAARELRDQELGRLAQRVAELEGQLAAARAELEAREHELNTVTDEMIEKEDLIESLREQLGLESGSGSGSVGSLSRGAAGGPAGGPGGLDDQDWSSLEF